MAGMSEAPTMQRHPISGRRSRMVRSWTPKPFSAALAPLAASLLLAGLCTSIPVAQAQTSATGPDITRYAGQDRYETSLSIAEALLAERGGTLEWAVVVSGRSWPHAVVAASLAGALDAPVLLSPPNELRDDTADFLSRAGVSNIFVVGTSSSPGISDSVVEELVSHGHVVERVAGDSASTTSVAVAERLGVILRERSGTSARVGLMPGYGPAAIVASSAVFADALVAGPVSAYGEHPVLLTSPQDLDSGVADYLVEANVEHVIVMGGTAAISSTVERALEDLGLDVTRLAGTSRFETAVRLAELVHSRYADESGRVCFANAEIGLARARVPFDSFSAAPLLAARCASLILTDRRTTNAATHNHLTTAGNPVAPGIGSLRIHVFGGQAAVADDVVHQYLADSSTGTASEVQPLASSSSGCGGGGQTRVDLAVADLIFHVSWNRDCSRMAYVNVERELWVANGDGSEARRLPGQHTKPRQPTWSPDGTHIAYNELVGTGSDASFSTIIVNADGGETVRVIGDVLPTTSPSWSPDGTRLAITRQVAPPGWERDHQLVDRFIVIVDAENGIETPLRRGGPDEVALSWSPDGRRIAYGSGGESSGSLWVMKTDGTGHRYLTAADWRRGANWSPDSTRLAAYRNLSGSADDFGENGIVVVDLKGLGESFIPLDKALLKERVFPDRAPQWSPDGQRLLFHNATESPWRYQLPANNWMQLANVPPQAPILAATCKPPSFPEGHTAGFPLPSWARASTGVLRVAVLHVDFPDAVATHSTESESKWSMWRAAKYLKTMSYGKLDVEYIPHSTWLRAEHEHNHYLGDSMWGELLWDPIGEHAVELADRDGFDFSDIDIVITVLPSGYFGDGGNEGDDVSADGNTMRSIRLNHRPEGAGNPGYEPSPHVRDWGPVAAHEILHSLGLADLRWEHVAAFALWPLNHPNAPPPLPAGERWARVTFGSMDLNGRARTSGKYYQDDRQEMLAWSRWQLGWLDSRQVECASGPAAEFRLSPVAEPGAGTAMAAHQVSAHGVIVMESRRLLGYDEPDSDTYAGVADGQYNRNYLNEGVLVYTVNSRHSDHPALLANDDGRGNLAGHPLLDVGESVSVAGYTITVTEDTGSEYVVSIRESD